MHCVAFPGDVRANEQNRLTIMHTVFMREHNRIEQILNGIHENDLDWDGERLFQVTRKIVAAELQQIVYREFLPVVIGADAMQTLGLTPLDDGFYTSTQIYFFTVKTYVSSCRPCDLLVVD